MKVSRGLVLLVLGVLCGCHKDRALEPLNECIRLESEGKVEEAMKACNSAAAISPESVAGLKAQLRLKNEPYLSFYRSSKEDVLVGKWDCVGEAVHNKPYAVEFFKDKTIVSAFYRDLGKTQKVNLGGTFKMVDDSRIKIDYDGSVHYAHFADGVLAMDGVEYLRQKVAGARGR